MKLIREEVRKVDVSLVTAGLYWYAVIREHADQGKAVALCYSERDVELLAGRHQDAVVVPVEVQE